MYKFTKEDFDTLKKDPFIKMLANICGVDYEKTLDSIESELLEEESKKNSDALQKRVYEAPSTNEEENLDKYVKAGVIEKCPGEDGWFRFTSDSTDEGKIDSPYVDELVEDESGFNDNCTHAFKASEDEVTTFIEDYRELDSCFRKLQYMYGINFNSTGKGESLYAKINSLIWFLATLAFGEKNAELICDYIFGNTEFDSIHDLYKKLV